MANTKIIPMPDFNINAAAEKQAREKTLHLHSIFESISGEAGTFPQGAWVTFIRLQGCNLRCSWCDTVESRTQLIVGRGQLPTIWEVAQSAMNLGNRLIVVTGGEPMLQGEEMLLLCHILITKFGCAVQIETNGSYEIPISPYPARTRTWVVDMKMPSSGEYTRMHRMVAEGHTHDMALRGVSVVKFVLANLTTDIDAMLLWMKNMHAPQGIMPLALAISPTPELRDHIPAIATVLKKERPDVLPFICFSVQLHKLLDLP